MLHPTIFALLVFPQFIHACSCGGLTSTCDRSWNLGEAIFLGKATSLEKVAPAASGMPVSYAVHFTVEESFRGASAPGAEMVVDTGMGGGDCGYPFVPGTSYLVYASINAGRLYAGICSQTKPAVMSEGVLRELRAVRDHKPVDAIFGTIGMAPRGAGWEDLTESKPLPGVAVRALGTGGVSASTQTDSRGAYAFPSLPTGTYTIVPEMPAGFARTGAPLTASVSADGACRADNFARPDGQINGTVVDAAGRVIPGFVTIQPADPAEAQRRGGLPGYEVGADGKFSLPQIPPGRYRLVFHPSSGRGVDFRVAFYWPSGPGEAIDLAFGQHVDGVQFQAQ
jgi:hypothetical protein